MLSSFEVVVSPDFVFFGGSSTLLTVFELQGDVHGKFPLLFPPILVFFFEFVCTIVPWSVPPM